MTVAQDGIKERIYTKPIYQQPDGDIIFASPVDELTELEEAQAALVAANIKISEMLEEIAGLQNALANALGV